MWLLRLDSYEAGHCQVPSLSSYPKTNLHRAAEQTPLNSGVRAGGEPMTRNFHSHDDATGQSNYHDRTAAASYRRSNGSHATLSRNFESAGYSGSCWFDDQKAEFGSLFLQELDLLLPVLDLVVLHPPVYVLMAVFQHAVHQHC